MKPIHLIVALCGASFVPGSALADTFSFAGSVQQFTAPTVGEYDIVVEGASGGATTSGGAGGLGAEVGGDFDLTAGEILDIYVGEAGQNGSLAGGGGGTFVVVDSTISPLVIAGGGGGGGQITNGQPGLTTVVNGGGGGAGNDGGGGGGFTGNGGNTFPTGGGSGFPNLAGGAGYFFTIQFGGNGGYGGGGGGGVGAGGGGGYGGGDGGGYGDAGGGGGSFLDPSVINALTAAGENSGNGMVTINLVPVPESGSLSLLALTLLAISGLRRLAQRG